MKYKYRVKKMIVTYKGKDYHPGEIIETDLELKHPYLVKVSTSKKKSNANTVEGDSNDKPGSTESNTQGSGKQNNE